MASWDLSPSASGPLPVANLEALLDLLERVEAATGPDREIDGQITLVVLGAKRVARRVDNQCDYALWEGAGSPVQPFTASLDAALALVERVLPGCRIELIRPGSGDVRLKATADLSGPIPRVCKVARTLPLALLATLLRAKLNAETGAETNG